MADSTKPNLTLCPALLATTLFSVRRIGQARDERAPLSLLQTALQAGGAAALSVAGLSGLLTTAQTPAAHASTHNTGGADALAIDAVAATGSLRTLGTASTQACAGNDSRLSNSRTPTAHASSHQSGGGDALALDTLAAPTDIAALNVSITAHGLAPKLPNDATKYLDGTGAYSVPPSGGLSNPLALGSLGAASLQIGEAGTGLWGRAAHVASIQANSLDVADFESVASAVNYLRLIASATGAALQIAAGGSDNNVSLSLVPRGTGSIRFPNGAAGALSIAFSDDGSFGTGFYANHDTNHQVVLASGGSNKMLFDCNGGVLVLPSGAAYRFSSTSDATGSPDAQIYRTGVNGLAIGFGSPGSLNLGKVYLDYTNTATVGAVTINKAAGRVNIAAAGASVVVTNSLVTAASHVIAVVSMADATAEVMNVVPAAGSFTITLRAAATGQVSVDFLVINAD